MQNLPIFPYFFEIEEFGLLDGMLPADAAVKKITEENSRIIDSPFACEEIDLSAGKVIFIHRGTIGIVMNILQLTACRNLLILCCHFFNFRCGTQITMDDNKSQLESSGLERFSHLEDKIFRIVEEFKSVRKDNESLKAENAKLKEQIEALHDNESSVRDNLAQFQKEREELRERVEKALNLLATLEAH